MNAIEFKTTIENGMIKIPGQYHLEKQGEIKVILLFDDGQTQTHKKSLIHTLMENPLQIEDFKPFTRSEIYE